MPVLSIVRYRIDNTFKKGGVIMKLEDFIIDLYCDGMATDVEQLMACDSTSCFTNSTSGGCFCQTD